MKLQIEFELSDTVDPISKDSLIIQLTEVIQVAIEERQLEISDAEIQDYEIMCEEF